MKFGIFLATQWPEQASLDQEIGNLAAQVRAARKNGFASVWVGQHVLTRPLQMIQTVPLLARLAVEGEGMTFGSCIALLGMLNPIMVAEEAASLDWITGGNFVLGVGIGYRKEEFDSLNVPFENRVGRFEEALPLIRRLWSEEWVTHKGEHFTVDNLAPASGHATATACRSGSARRSHARYAGQRGSAMSGSPHPRRNTRRSKSSLRFTTRPEPKQACRCRKASH